MPRGGMGYAKWVKDEHCTDIIHEGIITEGSCGPSVGKRGAQLFSCNSHNSSKRACSHFTGEEGEGEG